MVAIRWYTFIEFATYLCLEQALFLTPAFPPATYNHGEDVHKVQQDKGGRFPRIYPPVEKDDQENGDGNSEEDGVTQERASIDPKRFDDAHGTHDAGNDEGCRAKELPYSQTSRVGAQGRKCSEDVWAAVAKCKKSDASDILVQIEQLRNGRQIWAEEIGSADSEGREQEN